MSVTLATHCYLGDIDKLQASLDNLIQSHQYLFDEILVGGTLATFFVPYHYLLTASVALTIGFQVGIMLTRWFDDE